MRPDLRTPATASEQEPDGLTRRAALGCAAGALLTVMAACGAPSAPRPRRSVIVVGAGLAGLSAADALARAGWQVTVLEARRRVGGRVMTWRFPGGQWTEAGGEFIDTGHRRMRDLARRFELALDDLRELGSDLPGAVYADGERESDAVLSSAEIGRDVALVERHIGRLAEPLSAEDPVTAGSALDRRSVADLLDEVGLSADGRAVVDHTIIRDNFCVEPRELSLLALAHTYTVDGGETAAFKVRGGNDRIPRALARELGRRIVLGAPVTAIADDGRRVRVTAAGRTHSADHCVVAAPLPALRAVRFQPDPPPPVEQAIAQLRYGLGGKTALRCRHRVWRSQGFSGDAQTDLELSTTWDATDSQPGRAGVLLGYTMGEPGRRWTPLGSRERSARATAQADTIFPGVRAALAETREAWWSSEPYTGGTYAAFGVGQFAPFWPALRRPFGRVVLAGEHTDEYWGYMEGAVRSGLRAAKALLDA